MVLVKLQYNKQTNQAEWDLSEQELDTSKKSISILDLFLESDLPNIHKISEEDFRKQCLSYLENNRDGSKIAKQIEVGIPFPDNERSEMLEHFRIVDTPGIAAVGGFADRTLEFLINADAVIYIHKGAPTDKILHDALKNILPEKVKKHMLLVLTHKGQNNEETNEEILDQMKDLLQGQICSDKIFFVDSKTPFA
jgi:hypothetical protein